MRTFRLIVLLFAFVGCLSVGFLLGASKNVARAVPNQAPEAVQAVPSISVLTAPNGQRNLLLLGVDDLQAEQPRLQSAWLILYIPPAPNFTLLPLYPQIPFTDSAASLANIPVIANGGLDPSMRSSLEAQNIWWHNYAIIDQTALVQGINWLANDGLDRGSDVLASLPPTDRDPQGALLVQHNLMKSLCYSQQGANASLEMDKFITSLSGHLITDIGLRQAAAEWKDLFMQGGRFTCAFPTLKDFVH